MIAEMVFGLLLLFYWFSWISLGFIGLRVRNGQKQLTNGTISGRFVGERPVPGHRFVHRHQPLPRADHGAGAHRLRRGARPRGVRPLPRVVRRRLRHAPPPLAFLHLRRTGDHFVTT